jgi:pimeloyl-ACP methyl ester carboxylesterase
MDEGTKNSICSGRIVMMTVWLILGWLFAILFGLITISMLMQGNWLHSLVLLLIVLLCLPPVNTFISNRVDWNIYPFLRLGLIVGLLFIFGKLLMGGKVASVYKSPEIQARFMEIYDEKMKEWPVPYEDLYVDTEYGVVHVIASGPEDAPPMLLLHASGVSGWSWKYNVEELSQNYRTYAIDLISDAGKSRFTSLDHIMKTGQDEADLYAEIAYQLGVEKAYVVGASEGGFVASYFAIHYPERIEKLVLMGPMGYAGATQSVIRIMFAVFFPLKPIQESTFKWAFSGSAMLREEFVEWFPLTMTGLNNVKVAPLPLNAEQRQNMDVPVMFIFGERDNLVGDPIKAKSLVQDIPNVQIEIVEAGHLMGGEVPEECNKLILDFFAAP